MRRVRVRVPPPARLVDASYAGSYGGQGLMAQQISYSPSVGACFAFWSEAVKGRPSRAGTLLEWRCHPYFDFGC